MGFSTVEFTLIQRIDCRERGRGTAGFSATKSFPAYLCFPAGGRQIYRHRPTVVSYIVRSMQGICYYIGFPFNANFVFSKDQDTA